MSNATEKQRWTCPGCQKTYGIVPGKKPPDLCPDCRAKPTPTPNLFTEIPPAPSAPATEPEASSPPPIPANESLADPIKAKKWKPLAVVLPQADLEDLQDASYEMRERRFYADLAWKVTRFWFVLLFGPGALACFFIAPPLGFFACVAWFGIFIALSMPSSGALRE